MTDLGEVHKTIKKWLFFTDFHTIDLVLATYLTNQKLGTPVWIFLIDNPGETKTEILRSLNGLPNIVKISNITKAGFVSGNVNVPDLFSILKGKKTVLLIEDIAQLTSKSKDEKNEIFALFRNLFDGTLSKRTGYITKECDDAHVTLIGAGTKAFRGQYIIAQQLGNRELLFSPKEQSKYMMNKLTKSLENDNYEQTMRKEISGIVKKFLTKRKLKTIDNDVVLFKFLKEEASRLRILRASADIDYYNEMIRGEITVETPTRAVKQLKRLYEGLISLDDRYSPETAKDIIRRVVDSSGVQTRYKIMKFFNKIEQNTLWRASDIAEDIIASRKIVSIELEVLWQLGWLKRKIQQETVGGKVVISHDGSEEIRGGWLKEFKYYGKKIFEDSTDIIH